MIAFDSQRRDTSIGFSWHACVRVCVPAGKGNREMEMHNTRPVETRGARRFGTVFYVASWMLHSDDKQTYCWLR